MADSSPSRSPIRTKDYLSIANQFPANKPITVVHKLQFRTTAAYPASSPFAELPAVSGRDAFFQRYVPAGNRAAEQLDVKPAQTRFFSTSVVSLLQDKPEWDAVAVRTFESFAEYARYQTSEAYVTTAVPHRDAALRDWSLVACVEEEFTKA